MHSPLRNRSLHALGPLLCWRCSSRTSLALPPVAVFAGAEHAPHDHRVNNDTLSGLRNRERPLEGMCAPPPVVVTAKNNPARNFNLARRLQSWFSHNTATHQSAFASIVLLLHDSLPHPGLVVRRKPWVPVVDRVRPNSRKRPKLARSRAQHGQRRHRPARVSSSSPPTHNVALTPPLFGWAKPGHLVHHPEHPSEVEDRGGLPPPKECLGLSCRPQRKQLRPGCHGEADGGSLEELGPFGVR